MQDCEAVCELAGSEPRDQQRGTPLHPTGQMSVFSIHSCLEYFTLFSLFAQGVAGAVCSMLPAPLCCSRLLYFTSPGLLQAKAAVSKSRRRRSNNNNRLLLAGGDAAAAAAVAVGEDDDDAVQDEEDSLIYFEDGDRMDMSVYADLSRVRMKKIEEAISGQKRVYVDKHVLMHRLYVGLSSQMLMSTAIHRMLEDYLPITHYALLRPTLGGAEQRGARLAAAWAKAMQDSRAAADEADLLMVPSFHWARIYRI